MENYSTQQAHIRDIEELLHSFAEALSIAIDARSHYNGDHTKRVARYTEILVDYINEQHEAGECILSFSNTHKTQLVLAAYLHDIGKLATPISIMNKPNRLGGRIQKIKERMKLIKAYLEIDYLKKRITASEYKKEITEIDYLLHKVKELNVKSDLEDADIEYVNSVKDKQYIGENGKVMFYLTKYEVECLNIRYGTLTDEERLIIQRHAEMTQKMLAKVEFKGTYRQLAVWAGNHHEYLDGSGYPNHLTAEYLSPESRILTIVDIYDALTSKDRPYKQPITPGEAFEILNNMVSEGKLDRELVGMFRQAMTNYMGNE